MNPTAIGYARISEKDQSNTSLEDQAQRIEEYCLTSGITLEKVFTDNGKSAFTFDRPEWKKLENYLKKNKQVKYLIVKHIDRFSRATLLDALLKLNEIENKLKVKVLTLSDAISTDTKDLGFQLMRTVQLLMSNNERNRIQDRIKDGMYRSNASGRFIGRAPVGYKNSTGEDGKPIIIIDKEKAPHIKKVFRLFIEGMNVFEIRKAVPQLKIKGNSTIQYILQNPVYAGLIQLPAYKGKPSMEVTAIHEPIISKYDYYSAQSKFNHKGITVQPSEEVWLRGVLHCKCGRRMTAGNSRGKLGKLYWYYKCPEHKKNYSAVKLHNQFNEILILLSFKESALNYIRTKLVEAITAHQNKKGGNVMRLKLDLSKQQKKIEETQTRYLLNPDIDANVYSKVITDLKLKEMELEAELIKANTSTDTLFSLLNDLLPKFKNLPEQFNEMRLHQKQLFITTVFSYPLSYFEGIYTTPNIQSIFADKALILKEKNLLKIQQVNEESGEVLKGTPNRSPRQPLHDDLEIYLRIFVA